jgi:hypothetical protein
MTLVVAIVVGTVGVIAIVLGLGCFLLYAIGLGVFERGLNETGEADGARDQRAIWKISNLFLGRERAQKLIATDSPEANTRRFLRARMRIGLAVAVAGLVVLIASFSTSSWWPLA